MLNEEQKANHVTLNELKAACNAGHHSCAFEFRTLVTHLTQLIQHEYSEYQNRPTQILDKGTR